MASIARSWLLYDWRSYLAAVRAITFAGLLLVVVVVVQLALLLGLFGSVSVVIDKSAANLWIGFRNTPSVELGRQIGPGSDEVAWMHEGVHLVERYASAFGDLRRADSVPVGLPMVGGKEAGVWRVKNDDLAAASCPASAYATFCCLACHHACYIDF